jgi:mRNA interferase MazF
MNRGEVWLVSFDPGVEAEIRKTRPAVIVSSDIVGVLPLRVVVPITTWQPEFAAAA